MTTLSLRDHGIKVIPAKLTQKDEFSRHSWSERLKHVKAIEVREFIKENITVQYVIFILQIQETGSVDPNRTDDRSPVQTRLDSPVTQSHSVFEPQVRKPRSLLIS